MVDRAAKGLAHTEWAEGRKFASNRSRPLDESNQADTSGEPVVPAWQELVVHQGLTEAFQPGEAPIGGGISED
jgi:hypothetical protein